MAVVEAMGYGMAVVATGVGEIPEIPPDGGWVEAAACDPVSLGKALSDLLSDPAAVAEMGAANREKAVQEYEIEINARKVVESILGVVGGGGG
jgi:glycosyltransferase involved in cell wall biosynthesis